jgi:hypothetical protein
VKCVRFVDTQHARGVYGLACDDGSIEILANSLLDPVQRTGNVIQERDVVRYLSPVDAPNMWVVGLNYRTHAA